MISLACELWLTIGIERFWQIFAGPHLSSMGRIFRGDYDIFVCNLLNGLEFELW